MKTLLLGSVTFLILTACGPSAAEVAERENTIIIAAQQEMIRQQEHAKEQERLKNELVDLKSQLAGAETKLQSIEKFHLLRTGDQKAQQVADQTKVIEELRLQIRDLESRIDS